MTPYVAALIPAAGSGSRMGLPGSKLLLEIGGTALIARTAASVASSGYINEIVVPVPERERGRFEALNLSAAAGGKRVALLPGGNTRRESVLRGLEFCRERMKDPDQSYIAVHDGARCLVTKEIVDRAVEAAFKYGAVTAAVPMTDSLKRADGEGRVLESLSRAGVWAVQTPQVFKFSLLWEAHRRGQGDATDDASLVEALHPVHVVEGARMNFKITAPEDYEIARRLLG